jgi:hypothetical protein
MHIYPQLPLAYAKAMLPLLCGAEVTELRERSALEHPAMVYTAVGGMRIQEAQLAEVQTTIRETAEACGYPAPQQRGGYREFDLRCARQLITIVRIVPAESAKAGVWRFLCCVVLPDIVRWRFYAATDETPPDRFIGPVRNVLGRLWWRAYVLDGADGVFRGIDLLGRLSEEELVQLFERPTLAGCRPLVRATGLAFLQIAEAGFKQRQSLMREAEKRIMRLGALVSFDGLEPQEMNRLVSDVFMDSVRVLQGHNE